MSPLKQMQHKIYVLILENSSNLKTEYNSHSRAVRNSPFQESLGMTLLSLKLFALTMMFLTVNFILSLWSLMILMWMKLLKPLANTVVSGLNALYTSCRSVVDRKNTDSTQDEWPISQWNEAGDTHLDYTSTSSETHGEHKTETLDEKARKAGL